MRKQYSIWHGTFCIRIDARKERGEEEERKMERVKFTTGKGNKDERVISNCLRSWHWTLRVGVVSAEFHFVWGPYFHTVTSLISLFWNSSVNSMPLSVKNTYCVCFSHRLHLRDCLEPQKRFDFLISSSLWKVMGTFEVGINIFLYYDITRRQLQVKT